MSTSHAPRLPHSSPIPIFRKECRRYHLIEIWTPTVRRSFDPVSGTLKLAALGSTVVSFLSPGTGQSPKSCATHSHSVPSFYARVAQWSGCCWPLKSGAAPVPAATWADRRGSSSSHPFAGGRPSLPMSPHGKRLWSEAARRDETLEPVLWSQRIVCGGVG
ncbi:predicted protein [Chaetomium globosum CBS 148.51]|uniref:Uncharacterized protein n=1 Tax=Chaetomium globosum (strain ATCC 6205 / CBS 148.51 / DSM 1962 / NBRC 6347 / NRRL 1970) TaxID=306901 RepID=Q2GP21_CHAGB|nr:uncharacterized protein CHGG_10283 [Chaetomium globosum CBS 148.51]EAQ83879.1 predicted protein [Chaetomium globosum CBS 148.51]